LRLRWDGRFSLSGSDFVEMFVGFGAARVRDLFAQAQEKAPSTIGNSSTVVRDVSVVRHGTRASGGLIVSVMKSLRTLASLGG
jgi:hypothetical protein